MKRIGLILANPITNYGAHLQAFATQFAFDRMGVHTEILDMSHLRGSKYYYDFGFVWYAISTIVHKFFSKKNEEVFDDLFIQNRKERTRQAVDFRKRMLHDEISFTNFDSLISESKRFDIILIGSDQMWLPGTSFSYINSLRFVPDGIVRASYATSLGVSCYPRYCWNSARNMWTNMDYISVREDQGAQIIEEVCKNSVSAEVVVDPTYLLTKSQWEKQIPIQKMSDEKYVFCYFLGDDIESKLCAKRFAQMKKLKLVYIQSCESYSDIDRTFADEVVGAASPEEFINWIRGAECVFTDSFHGLAFSVINHIQFYVFYRVRKDTNHSRNSRIDNILNMWSLTDRVITNKNMEWNEDTIHKIDYDLVESIVEKKRNQSLNFIKKVIENGNK